MSILQIVICNTLLRYIFYLYKTYNYMHTLNFFKMSYLKNNPLPFLLK